MLRLQTQVAHCYTPYTRLMYLQYFHQDSDIMSITEDMSVTVNIKVHISHIFKLVFD